MTDPDQTPTVPDETTNMPVVESQAPIDTGEIPALEPGFYLVGSDGRETVVIALTDGSVRLGRGFAADVQIDDPTLSRRHAILVHEEGRTTVLDDRSANGTFVNGEQVTRKELAHGDKVAFGRIQMRYIVQAR